MKKIPEEMFDTLLFQVGQQITVRTAQPGATGASVIDEVTYKTIEVDKLFDAVNHAQTVIGQATLHRSLVLPSDQPDAIMAKQAALQEIEGNAALRQSIEELVAPVAQHEKDFYQLLFGDFLGVLGNAKSPMDTEGYGYEQYRNGTSMVLQATAAANAISPPQSPYLRTAVEAIAGFAGSTAHTLMQGPVYLGERGVKTAAEKGKYMPGLKFVPSLFKPMFIASIAVVIILLYMISPPEMKQVMVDAGPVLMLFLAPMAILYLPVVGSFDREGFIYPLRNRFKSSMQLAQAFECIGQLDELLAFHRYKEHFPHPMVLPTIRDSSQHIMTLRNAKNPMLAKTNPAYVGNDVTLAGHQLTFITGPNSGGKTAFCKTIAQIQLLAQIGCYVPAEAAELSVSDRLFYQVPEISSLVDEEGRFGTELRRTRDIFLATTPKSLVILDELSEGTTHEEKLATATNVLNAFKRLGNNTVLITHNHQLVDAYKKKGIGQYRQVEFNGEEPTHKLIEGISRISHADRIARRVGFSQDDIERYLREKGC